MNDKKFYGKYRGVVTDNKDPKLMGRVRATVTDVFGDQESGWATPCLPVAGGGMGFFVLPEKGAGVWIEFEHGDSRYPIWSGCWVGAPTDVPPILLAPPYKKTILITKGGNSILLDDTPGIGGITLKTSGGQKIVMSSTGIEITNGMGASIKMQGPKVSINGTALEVT